MAQTIKAPPCDDRYVIVQDIGPGESVLTSGARYKNGQWIGAVIGEPLPLSDRAIWNESFYFTGWCASSDWEPKQ